MATNHTENYQLNLWEPGDSFLRTEFNENTQKIDAAIKAEAQARAALAQQVAARNCRIVTGSYVGAGYYGLDHPSSLTFPGKPLFVAINNANACFWAIYKATGTGMIPSSGSAFTMYLNWSGNTMTWYNRPRW